MSTASARLNYRALHVQSNRLAAHLRARGCGSETPVGICLERSFDRIVASLAVWKAGGALLPLDPAWPDARLATVLDDAQAPIAITATTLQACRLGQNRETVALDRDRDAIDACASHDASIAPSRDGLAYIIYTSGSTGRPKGVEITHGNLLNLIDWHRRAFGVTRHDRASHVAGLAFDAAIWEIWPYLTAGATVVLPDETVRTTPELLRRWLVETGVTIGFVPTTLAEPLITTPWPAETRLRFLLTGGDRLLAYPCAGLPFLVVNNYGPTECAVVATSGIVPPHGALETLPSIGRPISNLRIHLLDERGAAVADGQPGEIHIGGAGVGRGYRNRPDLTAERFVVDGTATPAGGRLYRTGDLGRRLPTGEIAFCGRVDSQIQLHGNRIEPDEVASALNRHPLVAASAVVVSGDTPADAHLVAYVVAMAAAPPSATELRDFLGQSLPDFMIPAIFVRLDALPLTGNGKLDKQALPRPAPENALDGPAYRPPATPTERRLAQIMGVLLDHGPIGADDNFFLLGGHSLLGTQVVMRAREAFGVELTLRHLFEAETVANLAETIEQLLIAKLDGMTEDDARRRGAALAS